MMTGYIVHLMSFFRTRMPYLDICKNATVSYSVHSLIFSSTILPRHISKVVEKEVHRQRGAIAVTIVLIVYRCALVWWPAVRGCHWPLRCLMVTVQMLLP